jgi:hypothetical protein
MPVRNVTPILNVSDIGRSLEWFEALGWKRGFTWNDGGIIGSGDDALGSTEHGPAGFGSVCSGEAEIFLCHGAQGARGTVEPKFAGDDQTDGVWMSWWTESPAEVDRMFSIARSSGMTVTYPPTDKPRGVREFHLRHPDGNMIRVSAGPGEAGPAT